VGRIGLFFAALAGFRVSADDRIAGRPSRATVLEQFIIYAQSHPGVAFMRKNEIARFALESPLTVREGI
jgi:hypothetical protein